MAAFDNPTGPITRTMRAVALMLADAATFRTLTGTANRAAALAKIHAIWSPVPADGASEYTETELNALRPCARIYFNERGGGWKHEYRSVWRDSGDVIVDFEIATPEAGLDVSGGQSSSEFAWYLATVMDSIAIDIRTLMANGDEYTTQLPIRVQGPVMCVPESDAEIGSHWKFRLTISV